MAAKPKRKQSGKPKLTDKQQSERFKQTARELDVQSSENFVQIFTKIVPPKKRTLIKGG
jgi:hypothetical protein